MKRVWIIVLLVSVGLNIGLGARLLRLGHPMALPAASGPGFSGHEGRRGAEDRERPAPSDTTAWRRFMGRRVDHLAERLELNPAQVEIFRAAQATTGQVMRQKRRELGEVRLQVRDLVSAPTVDRQAVRQAMIKMGRQQAEMDSLVAETLLGELEILAPWQRALYLDILPYGEGQRSGRGGRGRDLLGQ